MTHEGDRGQQPDDNGRGWVAKSRDGVLLVLGTSMLTFETVGSLLGRPADSVIVGAALALLGLVPILQKEGMK